MNWFGYWLGKLLHWWLKADAKVKAANNDTASLRDWAYRNRKALVVRALVGAGIFYFWTISPDMMTSVVRKLSGLLADEGFMGIIRGSLATVAIPLNVVTAAAFGYVVDSVLDKLCAKLPFLREYIPEINGKHDEPKS